jgi:transposase-like protein
VDCDITTDQQKALMPHRNAPLTETGRLRLARCVVEDGWTLRRAAERFQVSPTTAQRWAGRYREEGEAGMTDRSSRPHHSPRRTPTRTERRIIKVRVRANAVDAMTFDLASLAGPALAGAVAGACGAPAGVVVAVALIGCALPAARSLPVREVRERREVRDIGVNRARPEPIAADLAAGLRAIARIRPLARATATSVLSCVGQGMLVACSPLLGERVLGGAGHGAVLLSGSAASALAPNALLARRPGLIRPDTVVWCGALVLAAAFLLAATCRPALVIAGVLLAGIGQSPQLTALFAVRHREAPERLRGQIFTPGASVKITGFALGAALAGPAAARSLPAALATAAGFELLAALTPVGYRDEITDSGDTRVGGGHPDRVPGPAQPPAG